MRKTIDKMIDVCGKFLKVNLYSLKTKLVIYISVLFGFMVIFCICTGIIAGNIIKQKTNSSVINTMEQTNMYLEFLFKKAKETGLLICLNDRLETLSAGVKSPYDQYRLNNDFLDVLTYHTTVNNEFYSIYVYFEDQEILITSEMNVYTRVKPEMVDWIKNFREEEQRYSWTCFKGDFTRPSNQTDEQNDRRDMMAYVARADIMNKRVKSRVYVAVCFSERDIFNITKNLKVSPDTLNYVLDRDGKIISAEDKGLIGQRFRDSTGISMEDMAEQLSRKVNLGRKGHFYGIYKYNQVGESYILVLLPQGYLIKEQSLFLTCMVILLLIVNIVLISFVVRIINRNVDMPVVNLIRFMRETEKGNFDIAIKEVRKDEFSYLYCSFNRMVRHIKELIRQLYQEQLLLKEMEIKVLQNQINPHFLYNTLDAINWLAKSDKPEECSRMIFSLSGYYRGIFNKGSDYIEIEKEMRNLEYYLYIQSSRCGNCFTYSFDVDEAIQKYCLLHFILQPIVENAFIHGLEEGKRNGGVLWISAKLEVDVMHFTLRDNGKGMNEQKLNLLRNIINYFDAFEASGLRNVNKRLTLFYGPEYGLKIDSKPEEGTKIEFYIPLYIDIEEGRKAHGQSGL